MLNKQQRKPVRDYIINVNVGKQGCLRKLAQQFIVPKSVHSLNMRHKSGLVCHSIWQTTYSPYKNGCLDIIGVPRTSLPALEQRRMEAIKLELERMIEDNSHPNQVFFSSQV